MAMRIVQEYSRDIYHKVYTKKVTDLCSINFSLQESLVNISLTQDSLVIILCLHKSSSEIGQGGAIR